VDAVHDAGMPGLFAEVRDGDHVWRGAAGVADVETRRPVTADAVLLLVEQGEIELDAPIGGYLPRLVPGDRGEWVTVRMLLNHTSGFAEYLPCAFPSFGGYPSLADISPESIEDNRFRHFDPVELIEMGLAAPATGEPGGPLGIYSNTNYLLIGELLESVTGMTARKCITSTVIEPAGLRHTGFPDGPGIEGPHSRMYEALFGLIDPPRDYSVYDMSWVGVTAGLVSTVADLNRFFGMLFRGEVVSRSSLAEMRRTVPVIAQDGKKIEYGLGLHRFHLPGLGAVWGNNGSVWGAAAISLTTADGERQLSAALNLVRWNKPDATGMPQPHPIDGALASLFRLAMRGEDD
jgi:D-alanyl-D-alanine carboxypeptidase